MADTKITALAPIGAIDPANDVLPIVDVSNNSMAASGTTCRVTTNQLLQANAIASLASATITGDLTVDTNVLKVDTLNNRVGIGTATPSTALNVVAGSSGINTTFDTPSAGDTRVELKNNGTRAGYVYWDTSEVRLFADSGRALTFYPSGTLAMTLNATGLGVGTSPTRKLSVSGAGGGLDVTDTTQSTRIRMRSSSASNFYIEALNSAESAYVTLRLNDTTQIDTAGNVGIGVTPSAWAASFKALQVGIGGCVYSRTADQTQVGFGSNVYFDTTDNRFEYVGNGQSALYRQDLGVHQWSTAPSGTAGNAITFTQAMTLDASGNLLVGSALPVSGGRISGNSSTGPAGRFFSSAGDNQFAAMFDKSSATNTTSQFLIGFTINNQATGSGQINANGASQAAFGTFSDSRLKENIVSLPSQLANILSLRPVEFDYKDGSGHQIGFVAQEMQEVYSDAVGEQNGFLTVTGWSKTEARLVSAIKELAAKVQALEAKLA